MLLTLTPAELAAHIAESVAAVLKSHNYAIVRNADTTYASDERDAAFCREVGTNAAQSILSAQDEEDEEDEEPPVVADDTNEFERDELTNPTICTDAELLAQLRRGVTRPIRVRAKTDGGVEVRP